MTNFTMKAKNAILKMKSQLGGFIGPCAPVELIALQAGTDKRIRE
jgi:hypothetical protein